MIKQVAYYLVGNQLSHQAFIDTSECEQLTDEKVVYRLQQWFQFQYNISHINKAQYESVCGEIQMGEFQLNAVHEA
tara:strand:- start:91 stop:318 length:228 start_codon:yes stop_codon:yes gene_type:complete